MKQKKEGKKPKSTSPYRDANKYNMTGNFFKNKKS